MTRYLYAARWNKVTNFLSHFFFPFLKGFCHKSFPPKFIFFFAKNTSQKEKMLKKLNFKRNFIRRYKKQMRKLVIFISLWPKTRGKSRSKFLGFELFLKFFFGEKVKIFF